MLPFFYHTRDMRISHFLLRYAVAFLGYSFFYSYTMNFFFSKKWDTFIVLIFYFITTLLPFGITCSDWTSSSSDYSWITWLEASCEVYSNSTLFWSWTTLLILNIITCFILILIHRRIHDLTICFVTILTITNQKIIQNF